MRLPLSIIKAIVDLPEGKPTSFTVRTDGKKEWRLEQHKTSHEEENDLLDLAMLWRMRGQMSERR